MRLRAPPAHVPMPPPPALTEPRQEVGEGASPKLKDLISRGPRAWMQARSYWGHGQPNLLENDLSQGEHT